jgi:hypothetical protein
MEESKEIKNWREVCIIRDMMAIAQTNEFEFKNGPKQIMPPQGIILIGFHGKWHDYDIIFECKIEETQMHRMHRQRG